MQSLLNQREIKVTWTLFLICLIYILSVMPMIVYDTLVDLEIYQGNSYIAVPAYCLYWSQYSLNFFIYAARSDQYRKAYLYFFQTVLSNLQLLFRLELFRIISVVKYNYESTNTIEPLD